MSESTSEELFDRFRRTGDPDALAGVFDLAAPKILRVALHVTGNPVEAEDLLQTTFLEAIECAHSFDRTRKVVPWLLGILTNQARLARRRAQRAIDGRRLPERSAEDPTASAQATELDGALGDAIAALPAPYQPVLLLALRNGISPGDIAIALQRPPGTVRSQLTRGMELLRRSLPSGFAVSALALALPVRGLAAIRTVVLAKAAAGIGSAAAPVAAWFAGGMLVKKTLFAFSVSACAVAALGWIAFRWEAGPRALAQLEDVAAVSRPRADEPEGGLARSEPVAATASRRIVSGSDRGTPTAQRTNVFAVLAGRCLDEHLQPLAGCSALVFAEYPPSTAGSEGARAADVRSGTDGPADGALAEVRSGTDGRFTLEVPAPTAKALHLLTASAGRVTRRLALGPVADGERRDLGDVLMVPGTRASGRVIDEDGRPVPGVRVQFQGPPLPGTDTFSADGASSWGVFTESDGRFEVKRLIRAGRWSLSVFGLGALVVRPETVDLADAPARGAEITVVVRLQPTISGLVVDEAGLPVKGLQMQAEDPEKRSRVSDLMNAGGLGTVTRDDGAFVLYPAREVTAEARVVLSLVVGRGFELVESGGLVAWGSSGVKLVARRAPCLELEVLEAGTSQPIERFAISLREDDALLFREAGRHELGRLRLEGLKRARYRLFVLPEDPELEPSERTVEVGGAAAARVTIFLARAATLRVRVTEQEGLPVPGSMVTLVDPKGMAEIGVATSVATAFATNTIFAYRPSELPVALHQAKSGPDGQATLRLPRGAARLFLRVAGGAHAPLMHPLDAADLTRGSVEVAVSAGARLEVAVTPASLSRYRPLLRLGRADAPAGEQLFPVEGVPLRGDGTCELAHAPPGEWDVFLCDGRLPIAAALSRIRLLPDEVARVEIALPHLVPGRLEAHATLDGAAAQGMVRLTPAAAFTSSGERKRHSYQVRQGRVAVPVLAPGRYVVELLDGNDANGCEAREPVEIRPGVAWSGTLTFERRSR